MTIDKIKELATLGMCEGIGAEERCREIIETIGKSPAPIDSAKVEDTGELVAWLIERGDALPEATAVEEYARIAARNGARVTPLVPTTGSEPWQVGDDTSSVQISRDGSTHKWGCKCDGCAPPPGSAPEHPFALIRDRNYDGEGLSLWVWNGENYNGTDGDCLSPDPDGSLDGFTVEWLTDYALECRLNAAPASPAASVLSDEQILALNAGEVFFSESPTRFPEAGHGTQYHAGAPGVIKFARALLAASMGGDRT